MRKNYTIIDPKTIRVQELCPLNGTLYPYLLVFRGYWTALTGDNVIQFESTGKPLTTSNIEIQATSKSSPIFALSVLNYYLVALRESGAVIYNLLDSTKTQEIEFDKGWMYKDIANDGNNIFIAYDVSTGSKKDVFSTIVYIKGIPADEQIKRHLANGNVQAGFKVFQQNIAPTNAYYASEKEKFDLEAAWALFKGLRFDQAFEHFFRANYDPYELLALVPGMLDKPYKTLATLIEAKGAEASKPDEAFTQGMKAIIKLVEEKRKFIESKFDLSKDAKSPISFLVPEEPINEISDHKKATVDVVAEILDTALLKLYVEQREISSLYAFITKTQQLRCNEKEMDTYLNERQEKDRSLTTQVCQALLSDKQGNYTNSLAIWKNLGQGPREIREMACRETARLLKTQVRDKKLIMQYARLILVLYPEDGLKIFTESEAMGQIMTEDDILTYLELLESYQPEVREKYLEYLINKKESPERFYTLLGLLYVSRMKEFRSKAKTDATERLVDSKLEYNRQCFNNLLRSYTKYNPGALLEELKGLDMFDEEVYLYTMQNKYTDALSSLVRMGSASIDFSAAEQYCGKTVEPLLSLLFEKIIEIYTENLNKLGTLQPQDKEYAELEKRVSAYKTYSKTFLKKYATNEKMNAENVLKVIPEDWVLKEDKDDSLLQYLRLTFNDRLGKEINTKIAKKADEMNKLDLESSLIKMQRAYVMINPENICKVCRKKLVAGKSYYVYPNGIVTHSTCAKDPKVCSVSKINFAKKVYL